MARRREAPGKETPVTRIGMSLDEYVALRLMPLAGADRAFIEAAEDERERMFPMPKVTVSHHLRSRGYDCRPIMLDALVEQGVVSPSEPDAWTEADVDAAAEHFEDCCIFVPYGMMCYALGCSYADFHRALREASERESAKYGRPIPADDQYFVMHRTPPREASPALLSFTLCDDIRERIERGEEV